MKSINVKVEYNLKPSETLAPEDIEQALISMMPEHDFTVRELPALSEQERMGSEIKRLRDALAIIVRNVEAGTVFSSWCGKFAKEVLENKWMPIEETHSAPVKQSVRELPDWPFDSAQDWREELAKDIQKQFEHPTSMTACEIANFTRNWQPAAKEEK